MKTADYNSKIMKKVINFEKKRVKYWFIRFVSIFFLLIGILSFIFFTTIKIFNERKILDILTLFGQDWETVFEFWQDNLLLFWEELPKELLILGFLFFFLSFFFVLLSVKKIRIIKKKLFYFSRFHQNNLSKGGE